MFLFIDVETQGLDSNKFVLAYAKKETSKKGNYFNNKEDLWNYILELGQKEKKRGKVLNVYSHNGSYDFYAYANIDDKNIQYWNLKPFIASYKDNEDKEYIMFLDTLGIFPTKLSKVGESVGLIKQDIPTELLEEEETHDFMKYKIKEYVKRDVEIIEKALLNLRKELKELQGCPKRLYTISQIAIHYVINHWKKQNIEGLFEDKQNGKLYQPKHNEDIRKAYKGGRVQCWKVGKIENVNYIDCNSLYPYASMNIDFPNLATERKTINPLKYQTIPQLLNTLGIHKCMIKNETDDIGTLTIKQPNKNTILKKGQIAIGTFTTDELKTALHYGHKIIDIEYSITYQRTENPFIKTINDLYEKKKTAKNEFKRQLYKYLMNCSFGKLGQNKEYRHYFFDSVESYEQHAKNGYQVVKGIGFKYLYMKTLEQKKKKPYYNPIIPALINAKARCYMRDQYEKIGKENLLYTDTDSIMFTGKLPKNIHINEDMGHFKIVHENVTMDIMGEKGYIVNNETVFAGLPKGQYINNIVEYKRQNSILSKQTTGTFQTHQRNLEEQREKYLKQEQFNNNRFIIIEDEIDLDFFIPYINEIQPTTQIL